MTQGLVAGAERAKMLGAGKEVQQRFIPLDVENDLMLTTGKRDIPGQVEFFGYYLGADELSGDYFYFQQVGNDLYAAIKCDVSGHGVPAALIMVEVATVFLNYFKDWQITDPKTWALNQLIGTINDLVNERGFEDKFALLTVVILNTRTGEMQVSHAGDRELRIFRAAERAVELKEMPAIPPTGTFPTSMYPNGYPLERDTLASGDVVLLPTDGIEESMRGLRNEQSRLISMSVEEFQPLKDSEEGAFKREDTGEVFEQLGNLRIEAIVRAVATGGRYTLKPYMDPSEPVTFDYKGLKPTAENIVYAIIAAERVWRLVPDPRAGDDEIVEVERNVDDFLRAHLVDFHRLFRHPVVDEAQEAGEAAEGGTGEGVESNGETGGETGGEPRRPKESTESQFVRYSHLIEDKQEDDLTILAIRKK
jgi:hypothetical protein